MDLLRTMIEVAYETLRDLCGWILVLGISVGSVVTIGWFVEHGRRVFS